MFKEMSHDVIRTDDNTQDTCLNCGQVGILSKECLQAKPNIIKKKQESQK